MSHDLVGNRQARHHYEILETLEAGIQLQGTEVKSLREHHGSLKEAYILPKGQELFLLNAHIPIYSHGNLNNHEERRPRKLLVHRRESSRLCSKVQEKGYTLVPLRIYLKGSHIKLELAVAKGKKLYDKRAALKERDADRSLQRAIRQPHEL